MPEHLRGISGAHGRAELPKEIDEEKAESARRFLVYYERAKENEQYKATLKIHKEKYG